MVGFTFVWWTGSRGAIIAIVGALLIGVVVIPAVRRVSVWGGTLLGLLGGALIASQLPAHGPLMGFSRTVMQTVGSGDVSTGRTVLWLNVLGAIRQRPIFGYGENQMATVAPFYGLGQTHNVVLQILLAWGVVGLASVAVLAVWFLLRSLPVVRRDPNELAAPFMAMATLASLAAYDGSLFHVVPVSIFAACAGMIAARWRTEVSSQ
jgi:O-antigen ligase